MALHYRAVVMGVSEWDEDDLYAGLDWLLERQGRIEHRLARRHLENDAMALYDLSSSYVEGVKCPLAKCGYNLDGKMERNFRLGYAESLNFHRAVRRWTGFTPVEWRDFL